MKRFVVILSLLLTCASVFDAQAGNKREELPFRHEIRLGWCGYPSIDAMNFTGYGNLGHYEYTPVQDIFMSDFGKTYMTGNIVAEIDFHIRKWFTFAVSAAVNPIWKPATEVSQREAGYVLTLMPHARFYWVNREMVRMYSSLGVGVTAGQMKGTYDTISESYLSAQLVPIGITVGRKSFGFAEVGYGSVYIGGMIGVGYRF